MAEHSLYLSDCKNMELTGVDHVNTFDEQQIILATGMGYLSIVGEGLHITMLNLDQGKVNIQGKVISLEYKAQDIDLKTKSKSLINRLFK
ncbi:MAG TPA: sporulation protein YabP [Syntrophomonadaceae bacterium]|nr:sporulation protein YabP [Syntrophomonadaceae bacterium]